MHQKKLLFVFSEAPYLSSRNQSLMENLLAHASLECQCRLLFLGAGLHLLDTRQQAEKTHARNLSKQLAALPLYDIEEIYTTPEAQQKTGLSKDQLLMPTKILNHSELRTLLDETDFVYHY